MKLEDYEMVVTFTIPHYWYEEGYDQEEYWVDMQNLYYYKFCEDELELGLIDENYDPIKDENGEDKKDPRKWWLIAPFKPKGTKVTDENAKELVKWLVDMCYLDTDDKKYHLYEWDFEKHCIKED